MRKTRKEHVPPMRDETYCSPIQRDRGLHHIKEAVCIVQRNLMAKESRELMRDFLPFLMVFKYELLQALYYLGEIHATQFMIEDPRDWETNK